MRVAVQWLAAAEGESLGSFRIALTHGAGKPAHHVSSRQNIRSEAGADLPPTGLLLRTVILQHRGSKACFLAAMPALLLRGGAAAAQRGGHRARGALKPFSVYIIEK